MLRKNSISVLEKKHEHITESIMMVPPISFTYNEQTAKDNEFQKKLQCTQTEVLERAMKEFHLSVKILRGEGVNVCVLGESKPVDGNVDGTLEEYLQMYDKSYVDVLESPDAVFCNNWISTHRDGNIVIYPMKTENRRQETNQLQYVQDMFLKKGFHIKNIIRLGKLNEEKDFLEGTGSLVICHMSRTIYAALSERTNVRQLQNLLDSVPYFQQAVVFNTKSSNGKEFYHTNVMMSIGDKFAVICKECIVDDDVNTADDVIEELKKAGKEIVEITLEQAEKHYCGNIIQIKSLNDEKSRIVMSESALNYGFTEEQKKVMEKYGKLVALPVAETIEFIGGGSARCMIAENFLPRPVPL